MPAATATTGPSRAARSALRPVMPRRASSGFSPRRTQNRKASVPNPMAAVQRFACVSRGSSDWPSSISVWPPPLMPSRSFSWLAAIRMPEAEMKPAITGWLRKFARNPSLSTPSAISISPDSSASATAAAAYSGVPTAATPPTAEAVISDTTATGPTASALEVPKIA